MKLAVNGLVIWEVKTGDADRIITVLTDNGIVTAYAAGSLRPKNKLTSSTALFSYSNFELFSGKNMYTVDDALSEKKYVRIYTDVTAMATAAYLCELLKTLAPVDEPSKEYLSLAMNSLYMLDKGKLCTEQIKCVFELRLMSLAGYMPDLVACASCGAFESERLFFNCNGGNWFCEKCAAERKMPLNCTAAALKAMRHILYSGSKDIFSFSLGDASLKTLCELCSQYIKTQLQQEFTTLDFLNVVKG